MNASMAWRIRNAEAILISAIDRRYGGSANEAGNRFNRRGNKSRFCAAPRSENRTPVLECR